MNEKYLKTNEKTIKKIRIVGFVLASIGLICLIVGMANFFNGNTGLFFLNFIGTPIFGVGLMLICFSYMRKISELTASQTAPVTKDVTNYMLDGTRDEVVKTIKAASDKKIICPNCHSENDINARFCSSCGKPLIKKCPHCDELNDLDAKYCKNCGKEL